MSIIGLHIKKYRSVAPEFNHTHTIAGWELKTYKTPVVYVWKRGDEWLYVGRSYCGMQRIMDVGHRALCKVEDTDQILMMYHLTKRQAQALELNLIRKHKPKYNTYS